MYKIDNYLKQLSRFSANKKILTSRESKYTIIKKIYNVQILYNIYVKI